MMAFRARRALGPALTWTAGTGAAVALVAYLAVGQRSDPARCPEGLIELGSRCCAPGQRLAAGRCAGAAKSCSVGLGLVSDNAPSCVASLARVRYPGGELVIAPNDWESQGVVQPRHAKVRPFELDSIEITEQRYALCVNAGKCARLTSSAAPASHDPEPGRALGGLGVAEVASYCQYAGGRIPTSDEWLFAATGVTARRFPWGSTGLVCRRAAFGLVDGPCAERADGPELAGSRPDGATPEGALDLSGNVAEWAQESDGSFVARGGSYRSRVAGELTTWAFERVNGRPADVGGRCAYDVEGPAH